MNRKLVIATAVAVVLVGGGTATALSLPSDGTRASTAAAENSGTNANKAVDTAASAVPGTVTGLDLENDGREWDVDVFGKDSKWHDVTVDPSGSKVVDQHLDADNDDRNDRAPRGADISVQKAMEAALKTTPGGRVTEVDLERGHWEVEVRDKDGREHDVNVDARTGKATVVRDQDDDGTDDEGTDDRATAGSATGTDSDD
ncbi:PepSY domain-containing protein [Streptomyces sp. NPDC021093]|uniref:PepSY domain-containing protein n=1 Tax=Streptomyces sp. NPDC021093 TaxID=3365112 RepID=UPI0037AA943C